MKFLFLLTLLTMSLANAQNVKTFSEDCIRIQNGICVDKNELGYIDGASSNLQTQITSKANDSAVVHLTGNETVSGVKTFNGKLIATSTTNGSIPCPVMTQAQRDAIVSPSLGSCITNSNTLTLNIYDGLVWKASGGGLSPWATGLAYAVDDIVIQSNKIYKCLIAHTAGTFATDLAALKWTIVSGTTTEIGGVTPIANGGTNSSTALSGSSIVVSNGTSIVQGSAGTATTLLHGNASGAPTYSAASLTADVSGILPLANGGTNKNMTASNGGIVYTDTDSQELLAPGTSGQILQTNGAAAPTFVNKSISGKAQNATAVTVEEMQVPNNLLTPTATNKYLNENGNKNILDNPSFEHTTFSTSWTQSGGSPAPEQVSIIDGKKSYFSTYTAATASISQVSTLYQANFADGIQGLASIYAKATVSGFYVCSVNNNTVQYSNCAAVASGSKWAQYKVPFVLGGTNNGIAIISGTLSSGVVTPGIITGDIYLDDAFVGVAQVTYPAPLIGPWVDYGPMTITATTTAPVKGTTSNDKVLCRQNGSDYECDYLYVQTALGSGTLGAGGYIFALPAGVEADSSVLLGVQEVAGALSAANYYNINQAAAIGTATVGDGASGSFPTGVAYLISSTTFQVNFAYSSGSAYTIPSSSGSIALNSALLYMKFRLKFRGKGLSSSINTVTQPCVGDTACTNDFSAKISSAGVVSSENIDWINGNCVVASGVFTCTYNSSIFTVAPNCNVTSAATGSDYGVRNVNPTSTTAVFTTLNTSTNTAVATAANITCQKASPDYKARSAIVGSFREVATMPGINKPKTCHYAFGGAAATLASPTECTTGTCVEVVDTCGATPPAFNTTAGRYDNITFPAGTWANSTFMNCSAQSWDAVSQSPDKCLMTFETSDNSWSSTSTGGYVGNIRCYTAAGVAENAYVSLDCTGESP